MAIGKHFSLLENLLIFAILTIAEIWPIFMFIAFWADADSGPSGYADKWYFHERVFLLTVAFFMAPIASRAFGVERRRQWMLGIQTMLAATMLAISVDMILTPGP